MKDAFLASFEIDDPHQRRELRLLGRTIQTIDGYCSALQTLLGATSEDLRQVEPSARPFMGLGASTPVNAEKPLNGMIDSAWDLAELCREVCRDPRRMLPRFPPRPKSCGTIDQNLKDLSLLRDWAYAVWQILVREEVPVKPQGKSTTSTAENGQDSPGTINWPALENVAKGVRGATGKVFRYLVEQRCDVSLADVATLADWDSPDEQWDKTRQRIQSHIDAADLPYLAKRFDNRVGIVERPSPQPKTKLRKKSPKGGKPAVKKRRNGG